MSGLRGARGGGEGGNKGPAPIGVQRGGSELVTSFDALPLVLLVADIARLMRRSPGTVIRDCRRGTLRPRPFATRPYRWYRDAVRAYFDAEIRRANETGGAG